MDPIATLARLAGEKVAILAPAETAPYRPGLSADYVPAEPSKTVLRGFPDRRVDFLDASAAAQITVSTSKLPVGLTPDGAIVEWRDKTWTVLKFRERSWRGKINGYTLALAQGGS